MTETTHKAWGGALAAAVSALVPIGVAKVTGGEVDPTQIANLNEAVVSVGALGISAVVGFFGVYFSPKNRPK